MNVIIFGVGGSGSNLAYMLSKSQKVDRISLVDFDIIEHKNLERQFFIEQDIGKNKAEAVAGYLKQFSPSKEVFWFNRKIEKEEQLADFNKEDFVFLCTDNIASKKLISKYFHKQLVVGCDDNLVEFRNKYEGESVWSIGEGYNSTQNFESNLFSAAFAYSLFEREKWKKIKNTKITLSNVIDRIVGNEFDRTRSGGDHSIGESVIDPMSFTSEYRPASTGNSETIEFVIEGDSETINVEGESE